MMKYFAIFALFVAAAYAQLIAIYNPTEGVVFDSRQNVRLEWGYLDAAKSFDQQRMNIDLVYGDANNARFAKNIVTDLAGKETQFMWQVPEELGPRDDYFLKVTHVASDGRRQFSYSPRFQIRGTKGTSDPTPPKKNAANSIAIGITGASVASLAAIILS